MKEGDAESEAAKTTEAAEEEEEEEEEEDEGLPGGMPSGCVLVIEGIQNREIGKGAIKAALEEDFDVSNFYFGYLHPFLCVSRETRFFLKNSKTRSRGTTGR